MEELHGRIYRFLQVRTTSPILYKVATIRNISSHKSYDIIRWFSGTNSKWDSESWKHDRLENSSFSSTHEKTLDACYSINLNSHLVPIISITRNIRFRLGYPYSACEKHTHNDAQPSYRQRVQKHGKGQYEKGSFTLDIHKL